MKRLPARGFTLLELLIVAVILTLLSVVVVQVFLATMRTNSKSEVVQDVKASGDHAIEMMSRMIQNAQSVQAPVSPASCDGTPIDTVTFLNQDGGQTTLSCIESGGIARIASVSASQTVYLTGTNVTLVDSTGATGVCANHALSFSCLATGGLPISVSIAFTLKQSDNGASVFTAASSPFQTTVVLRNK